LRRSNRNVDGERNEHAPAAPTTTGCQPGRESECGRSRTIVPSFPALAALTQGRVDHRRRQRHRPRVAVAMAREGAKIAIVYLEEHEDATRPSGWSRMKAARRSSSPAISVTRLLRAGRRRHVKTFGRLDILVNNAAEQHEVDDPLELTAAQIEQTSGPTSSATFPTKAACATCRRERASSTPPRSPRFREQNVARLFRHKRVRCRKR